MVSESPSIINVISEEKKISENSILEALGNATRIERKDIIDRFKESIAILDREIKQQAVKYITTSKDSKKNTRGGLNRRKKSLKKSYGI